MQNLGEKERRCESVTSQSLLYAEAAVTEKGTFSQSLLNAWIVTGKKSGKAVTLQDNPQVRKPAWYDCFIQAVIRVYPLELLCV
ncbi:MAG: hypothetical protein ACI8ZB_004850 [Desulforhopalus sp.]|jgi:hypothetical protein